MKAILFFFVIFFSYNINAATLSTALTLNGLQWAQLSDTTYLYVPDVYDACGNSGGTCNGVVDGKDLTGWRWASQSEVNMLINDFFGVGYPFIASGIDTSPWFDYFPQTGGESNIVFTIGLSADFVTYLDGNLIPNSSSTRYIYLNTDTMLGGIGIYNPFDTTFDQYGFGYALYPYSVFMVKGSYVPPSQVPLPASLFLFAPALLGLIGLRRKWS